MTVENLTLQRKIYLDRIASLINPAGETWLGGSPQPTSASQITILTTPLIYIRAGEKLLLEKQQQYQKEQQKDK